MTPVWLRRLRFYLVLFGALGVIGWIIVPPGAWRGGARHNARRASCQSSLKQIGLALRMYAADYDECFPARQWGKSLLVYAKNDALFQCPETSTTPGTSDYFFNARFLGAATPRISTPNTLVIMGDGPDDAPLDSTLPRLPAAWCADESSPAWRHLGKANYAFADGHVKWLKADRINRDFREVTP